MLDACVEQELSSWVKVVEKQDRREDMEDILNGRAVIKAVYVNTLGASDAKVRASHFDSDLDNEPSHKFSNATMCMAGRQV